MAADNGADHLTTGERVVASGPMPGLPEGTRGKVILVEGLTWIRYWVRFDNGVVRGSLHRDKLARAREWKAILAERARVAALPPEQEKAAEAGEAADDTAASGSGASGPASKVPAHLLERSRQARAKANPGA
ncbi:MAG: hypothetical protein ACRD0A_21210 [Acidimicrobiales bacterium]